MGKTFAKKHAADSANAPGKGEITTVGCLAQNSSSCEDEKMSKPNKEKAKPPHTGEHEKISRLCEGIIALVTILAPLRQNSISISNSRWKSCWPASTTHYLKNWTESSNTRCCWRHYSSRCCWMNLKASNIRCWMSWRGSSHYSIRCSMTRRPKRKMAPTQRRPSHMMRTTPPDQPLPKPLQIVSFKQIPPDWIDPFSPYLSTEKSLSRV